MQAPPPRVADTPPEVVDPVLAELLAELQSAATPPPAPSSLQASPPSSSAGAPNTTLLKAFGGIAALVTAVALPFLIVPWLPRAKFGALPWYPTSARRIRAVLDALPREALAPRPGGAPRRFLDLGAGDGVCVIEAAAHAGLQGVGVELNPTLVAMSRVKAALRGVAASTSFTTGNLWTTPVVDYDLIMVFGVVPAMPRLAAKLEAEASPGTYVLSHKFELRGWGNDKQEGGRGWWLREVDGIHVYRIPEDWRGGAGEGEGKGEGEEEAAEAEAPQDDTSPPPPSRRELQ